MTNEDTALNAPQSGGCCGSKAAAPAQPVTGDDHAVCPVMAGTPVVKSVAEAQGLFRDYNGGRYWFCCASCGPLFDADPAKYATAAA
ncbi:YHS domain-containing protein [Streptomyces sp. NPDC000994]